MIYRLGLTPDKIFIESKKISHILVADASGESGPSAIALEGVAKELGPKKLKYISGTKRVETLGFEAGVYEAYLREEGQKYQAVQDGYTEASDETSGEEVKLKKKSSKSTRSTYIYTETDRVQALSIAKEKRSIAFLYLGVIPLLFLGMLITLGTPPKSTTTNSNTVVRSSSWWNTNWSSGGSNSSWTSNASKNTSSISTSF